MTSNLSPVNLFSHIKNTLPAVGNLMFDQKKLPGDKLHATVNLLISFCQCRRGKLEGGKKGGRRGVFEFFKVLWLSFFRVFMNEKRSFLEVMQFRHFVVSLLWF